MYEKFDRHTASDTYWRMRLFIFASTRYAIKNVAYFLTPDGGEINLDDLDRPPPQENPSLF